MSLAASGSNLLRDRAADLCAAVESTLRQNVFDNVRRLASVRALPAASRAIVDTFLHSLDGGLAEAELFRRVADLVDQGLGPRSAVMAVDCLTQTALAMLEADPDQLRALRPAADAFRRQFELGYIQARADDILREQGRIHHGLTRALETQISLERSLRADLQRRQVQLQTAAEIARIASSILEPGELLRTSVDLIRERFKLYYVGIFLVDEPGEWAVLYAGTGEAGREMLRRGHKLQVGGASMIGWCVAQGRARIALDVGQEPVRFDNPLLPDTHSEMALPLISRGQVIGAMTIQSDRVAAFSDEDIITFETLAGQLANAIQNARLFEQLRVALQDLETAQRRYIGQAWQSYATAQEAIQGYQRTMTEARPAADVWLPAMTTSLQRGEMVIERDEQGGSTLALPFTLHGEVIGVLGSYSPTAAGWSQEDLAAVETIAEQMALALENQRLFDEAQRATFLMSERVKALDCLNDIGRKMDETPPVPEFLQWVAERIPLAMRHAGVCRAAIEFEGQVYGAAEAIRLPRQMVQQMRIGGEAVGRVYVAYTEDHGFLDEESALLGDITRRVSGYIENRRLIQEAQELATRERLSRTITDRVRRGVDREAIMRITLQELGRMLGASEAVIRLGTQAQLLAAQGTPPRGG